MIENFISDAALAFFGSLGHCFFMCGGFVASFNKNKNILTHNIIYHISKMFAYIILGIIFSLFGKVFIISGFNKGILYFLIGVFMMVFGVAFFSRGKLLSFFEKNQTLLAIILKLNQKVSKLNGVLKAFLLGFINGFLPCGLVYVFLAKTMSKSLLESILLMSILGFVSMCVMVFFSFFLGFLKSNFAKIFLGISSLIIFTNGLYYAYMGLELTR